MKSKFLIIWQILKVIFGRGKKPDPFEVLTEEVRKDIKELDDKYDEILKDQKTANPIEFKRCHFRLSANRAARTKRLAELGVAVLYRKRNNS